MNKATWDRVSTDNKVKVDRFISLSNDLARKIEELEYLAFELATGSRGEFNGHVHHQLKVVYVNLGRAIIATEKASVELQMMRSE